MNMEFRQERIGRIVRELGQLRYKSRIVIPSVEMKDGYYTSPQAADGSDVPYRYFGQNELWGGNEKHAWFRSEIQIPEYGENESLVYELETKDGGWDSVNPQGLLFVDGLVVQGLDTQHRSYRFPESVCGTARIDVQAYGGNTTYYSGEVGMSRFRQWLVTVDRKIDQLYHDIRVPHEIASLLEVEDRNRRRIMSVLEKAINMLDLRKPYSEAFYIGLEEAEVYLHDALYKAEGGGDDALASCVGHTHIDVAWLWDLDQTRQKVQRSFATVLKLMEDYPEYKFMSSQPQLYQYLKEERPELYEAVRERVKEGRWETEGAMWVEADCNISSGEALIRQIIHGKRFFREEFGVENKVLWLPDVFGYSAALPQILKKSGIDYFMTTKISWNEYNKIPYDTLKWVGIDGSEVLSHFVTTMDVRDVKTRHETTYNGYLEASSVMGAWERYQQKTINDDVLISFGYGDGGGGPTETMLENARRLSVGLPGCPKTSMTSSYDYFKRLEERLKDNPKLPKWVGELYLEYHRGTLTSMARNKRYNRKAENLYMELEWLRTMAKEQAGLAFPKEAIKAGWEIICLNQFHDIIPGSSIKKVYEDSKEQYESILKVGEALKEEGLSAIVNGIEVNEASMTVFNPVPFERSEVLDIDFDGENIQVYVEQIPPRGYKTVAVNELLSKDVSGRLEVTEGYLANDFIEVKLDDNGHIISLVDVQAERELIPEGKKANLFQAFEDKPHNYDAWDINVYYKEKMWPVEALESIELVEKTPYRGTLKIIRRFMDSTIVQYMTLRHDSAMIEFRTEVDWKEKQVLLKVAFPSDVHNDKATYDIQYGNIERPTHSNTSWDAAKFEVCGHHWADLSEGNYGVSLLNDCKYGYDITDRQLRLTLIKSPIAPNEDADREMHHFTYAYYPHSGDLRHSDTIERGYCLNNPVTARVHESTDRKENEFSLPGTHSLVTSDCSNVVVEVVKEAEDSSHLILRVYETGYGRTKARIAMGIDAIGVWETDMEEKCELRSIMVEDNAFTDWFNPYEIKTYKLVVNGQGAC